VFSPRSSVPARLRNQVMSSLSMPLYLRWKGDILPMEMAITKKMTPDVKLGKDVKICDFVNLYWFSFMGTFLPFEIITYAI
jgi:hypothetical protein